VLWREAIFTWKTGEDMVIGAAVRSVAKVCCSVLQCVAVCCSALQYVAECCSVLQCVLQCDAV